MATTSRNLVGTRVQIKAGTRVRDIQTDIVSTRARDSIVTVRKQEVARGGKTRIYWKSSNYQSALI